MKKYSYLLLATYCIIHSTIAIVLGFAVPLFIILLIENIFLLGFRIWYLFIFDRYEEVEEQIKEQDKKEKQNFKSFFLTTNNKFDIINS